jgi:hypothetical protein
LPPGIFITAKSDRIINEVVMSSKISILPLAITTLIFLILPTKASININVDAVQKSVIFLYAADPTGAVDKTKPIATGFFVEIPLTSDPRRAYRVIVTARHIVDPIWAKCPQTNPVMIYARLNKNSYKPGIDESGIDFIPIKLSDQGRTTWNHHADNDIDAAVILPTSQINYDLFDTAAVPVSLFPTEEELAFQSIGDPVMSAGLMPGLTGNTRNYPIFKFGQISNIPPEDIETHCTPQQPSFLVKVWLIAANLVPGNSGSPIFHVPLGGSGVSFGGTRPMLLGGNYSPLCGGVTRV